MSVKETLYQVVRVFADRSKGQPAQKRHLTLEQAAEWCRSPETCSRTATEERLVMITENYGAWFDCYVEE